MILIGYNTSLYDESLEVLVYSHEKMPSAKLEQLEICITLGLLVLNGMMIFR